MGYDGKVALPNQFDERKNLNRRALREESKMSASAVTVEMLSFSLHARPNGPAIMSQVWHISCGRVREVRVGSKFVSIPRPI